MGHPEVTNWSVSHYWPPTRASVKVSELFVESDRKTEFFKKAAVSEAVFFAAFANYGKIDIEIVMPP